MMVSFVLSFFPRDVLDEILNLIESVSEGFPSYSCSFGLLCVSFVNAYQFVLMLLSLLVLIPDHYRSFCFLSIHIMHGISNRHFNSAAYNKS